MQNTKPMFYGFLSSLGVLVYVAIVAFILQNAESLFGNMETSVWGPIAFLMLFTLSVAVVGSLIFGKPALLYLNGQKKEGLTLLGYTIGFLSAYTFLVLLGVAMFVQ